MKQRRFDLLVVGAGPAGLAAAHAAARRGAKVGLV
ncbi:MAG: FAD-dependent oxidoreductase, partial [Stenotrophomonas sp.]|nr:FAD-dependent oxidoreductase [Stenotrophomonas sp.]